MNKDEIQSIKAFSKMNCIKRIIDVLQELNLLENNDDMKKYNIVLDYVKNKNEDFTTFKTTIYSNRIDSVDKKETKMFDFNFKLKDETTGFAILKSIREYFLSKNDLQYSGFRKNDESTSNLEFETHEVITNHNVNLISKIHSKKDILKLEEYNNKIINTYEMFVKTINTTGLSRDEIQVLKAYKKAEIVMAVIDMLHDLESSDIHRTHIYDISMDYKQQKEDNDDFTVFDIKLLKDSANLIFNLNFKLKDEKIGIELFNKISKHFVDKNKNSINYFGDSTYNKDTHIINAYGTNLKYKIPQEYFNKLYDNAKESLNQKHVKVNIKK